MANSYYEELQKRRAAEEAARKEAAKGYRQAVEAGKNAKSQRENPAVTTTEYTQRQRRAKQAADLFPEPKHPVKSNPYLMATANEGMAREQAAKAEEKYTAFMNEDSEDSPAAQVTQGPQIQHQAQQLQEETERWNAEADYWKNQKTAHKEQAVMKRDMEEFAKWPEEDRELMERYARGRNMMPLDIGATAAQRKLAEKYGLETLNRMEESYSRSRNQESAEKVSALGRKNATGAVGKVLSSAASVGTSLMSNAAGAMDTLYAVTNDAITGTGRYSSLDPNLQGNLGAVYSGAVRGKVSGDLEKQGTAGKVGSVVYQGAMSAADSLARLAVAGEAGSLALAGLGSFGQTVSDVSAKGGNQYQAIGMGVVTAGLEVLTEKVSLDNLLTRSKGGYQGAWNAVKDAFVQAGVEVSEEELSFIGSTLAEAAILRDKSDYRQHIGDLVAGGMSYQEAKEEANRGLINEALQTAAVSAVSGGLMSGGASVVNKLTGNAAQPEAARNMEPAPVEAAPEVGAEAGQEAQKETEAEMKRRTTIEAVREVVGGKVQTEQTDAAGRAAEYKAAKVNTSILSMIERVKNRVFKANEKVQLGKVSDANAAQIQRETGIDVRGYEVAIEARQIDHILKDHGESGAANRSMADPTDIARMEYALNNPDRIVKAGTTRAYVTNKNGKMKPADTVLYEKRLDDGSYYVVQAVPETKNKTLYIVTAFIGKSGYKNGDPQSANTIDPGATPEAESATTRLRDQQSANINGPGNMPGTEPVGSLNNNIPESGRNVNRPGANPESSVGAAPAGFSPFTRMQNEYGNIPDGENPVRPDDMPLSTDGTDRVSYTARTAKGAEVTPDEFVPLIENETVRGGFSFIPITNDTMVQQAEDVIMDQGWEAARADWTIDVRRGRTGADTVAMGALLYNNAVNEGNFQEAMDILVDYQLAVRNSARGLQAARILKTLTPENRLYMLRRSVQRMIRDMGLDPNSIRIDDNLARQYQQTRDDAAADQILDRIIDDVARQIPPTLMEQFTAIRYLNMLGNFRTQGRNLAGNFGAKIAYATKDKIAAIIESIASAASGGTFHRTKSVFISSDMRDAARADFDNVREMALNGGRYNDRVSESDDFARRVQERRRMLPGPLESYRRATNWAMEQGDVLFSRSAYAGALAGYLQANGIRTTDFSQIDQNVMDEARAYAIRQAQEATFRDNNQVSDFVSRALRGRRTPWWARVIGEGAMPFRKTPANVLVRAEEFSPIGLFNSLINTVRAARGNITGAELIDSWAKSITGTALFAAGWALANMGCLTGGDDEDEDKQAFDEANGYQNWAFQLPNGVNLTIDCFSPVVIPMLMGAQLKEIMGDDDITWADVEGALMSLSEPMIEMSMLSGVNDILENVRYSDNSISQIVVNVCLNYVIQGLGNALIGQLERSSEDVRMTTYVDKDSNVPVWLQRQLGKLSQKIPGWDYQQIPYINAWGQEEKNPEGAWDYLYNLLSPSYISKGDTDAVASELYRLNEVQSDVNVFPNSPEKTLTYTDSEGQLYQDYNLSADEWQTMARAEGQTQNRIIRELIQSEGYAALTDSQKAKAVGLVYDYAREAGRVAALENYGGYSESWMEGIDGQEGAAIIRKVATAAIGDAFDAMTKDWKNGGDGADGTADLEAVYGMLQKLDGGTREEIRENASSRVGDFLTAVDAGVDAKTFAGLYQTYYSINTGDAKAGKKANDWAYQLQRAKERGDITAAQLRALKSAMTISSGFTVEAEKFDAMAEAGIRAEKADYVTDLIAAIKPQKGYADVRDIQKAEKIAYTTGLTESERATVMKIYMPAAQDKNLDEMLDLGYSVRDYVTVWQLYDSGKGKKARTIAAIREELGCDHNTAKAVYEIYG